MYRSGLRIGNPLGDDEGSGWGSCWGVRLSRNSVQITFRQTCLYEVPEFRSGEALLNRPLSGGGLRVCLDFLEWLRKEQQ